MPVSDKLFNPKNRREQFVISFECKEHGVTHISHSFVDGDIVVLVKYPKEK